MWYQCTERFKREFFHDPYNFLPLQWRHKELDCVSDHQPHDCLLNRLFSHRSKKTSKLLVTGLCVGNSPVTGEFPAQRASNAENVSIWWRHHAKAHLRYKVVVSRSGEIITDPLTNICAAVSIQQYLNRINWCQSKWKTDAIAQCYWQHMHSKHRGYMGTYENTLWARAPQTLDQIHKSHHGNVHISVLNGALGVMGQVHCGICDNGLLGHISKFQEFKWIWMCQSVK